MEVDQQVMACGALQQVLTIVHVALVVAREEVDFYAGNPDTLTPRKLLLTVFGFVQTELGTRRTIHPTDGRIIPDEWADTFLLGVSNGVLDGLAILHFVPLGINKYVWQVQGDCHINILADDVVVVGTVVIGPINPRCHTGLNPAGFCNL